MFGLKDIANICFFDLKTNEVTNVYWCEKEIQKEADRLIALRNKTKKKRIRKKLNKRINKLLNR